MTLGSQIQGKYISIQWKLHQSITKYLQVSTQHCKLLFIGMEKRLIYFPSFIQCSL